MAVTREQKDAIVKKFRKAELDTGSSPVQIALLTQRINELTSHFAMHKKDVHGVRGLMVCVNRRRKLLDYLKANDQKRYETIIRELDIRK